MHSSRSRRSFLSIAATLLVALAAASSASASPFAPTDDYATAMVGSTDNTISVLSNDGGAGATVTDFDATSAAGGTVDCSSGSSCLYTPPLTFVGQDSFNYTADDTAPENLPTVATAYIDVVETNEADLQSYVYGSAYPAGAGDPFTYYIQVLNNGPAPAYNVTVTDALPAGVTNVTFPGDTYNCQNAAGTVTCHVPRIAAYTWAFIQIDLNAAPAGPSMRNDVNASAAQPSDPAPENNAAHDATPVSDGADVSVWTSTQDVDNGSNPSFTTTTYNSGPKAAANTHTINHITGGTVTEPPDVTGETCTVPDPHTVDCVQDPLAVYAVASATFTVHPDANDSVVLNDASVSSTQTDPYPYDDTASASAAVGTPTLADLSIWKWGQQYAAAGQHYTFNIDGSNYGPAAASDLHVTDDMPSGMTISGVTANDGITCDHSETHLDCHTTSLAVDDYYSIQVDVLVAAGAAAGMRTNTAQAHSSTADRYPWNNSADSKVEVLAGGVTDLQAGMYGPPIAAVNTPYSYSAWVFNNGPSDATGASVELHLPANTTGTPSAHVNDGSDNGAPCGPYNAGAHTITCSGLSLDQFGWLSIDVDATPAAQSQSDTYSVHVTGGVPGDPNTENDTATMDIAVYPAGSADLEVTQSDSADPAAVGEPLIYTVSAVNNGPFSTSGGVTITDHLPAGVTFVSAKRGDGTSCPAPSGGVINCPVGDIGAYEGEGIEVKVTPQGVGSITNVASAEAGSGVDPHMANNTASESTDVNPNVVDNTGAESGTGHVDTDPETGEVLITIPRGNPSAVTLSTSASCPAGTVTGVSFVLGTPPNTVSFPAVNTTGTIWEATIQQSQLQSGTISAQVSCSVGNPIVNQVGHLQLYDPSGVVTDAVTHQPIADATVTLYRVPGWSARTGPSDNGANTCQSNLSKGNGAAWSQAAPTGLGELADPASGLIDPASNPLQTTAQGRYGWNVAAGCWYVVVAKAGYNTLTSPVVGVPTEVTDLDLQLTKPVSSGGGGGGGDTGGGGSTPAPVSTDTPANPAPGDSTKPPVTTPAATKCVVPKLIGLTLAKAKKALAKAHCGVGRIVKKAAKAKKGKKKAKKGTVIAQSPAAGTKKPAGSKVALTLAK